MWLWARRYESCPLCLLPPRPSEEMVKMVLSRACHPDDQFTTSILRHWCMKHDELLAEHIKSLLIKNNSLPRKRQRWARAPPHGGPQGDTAEPALGSRCLIPRSLRSSSSKLAQLTLEQILEHLDNLRLNLTNTKQNCMRPPPWALPSCGVGGGPGPAPPFLWPPNWLPLPL